MRISSICLRACFKFSPVAFKVFKGNLSVLGICLFQLKQMEVLPACGALVPFSEGSCPCEQVHLFVFSFGMLEEKQMKVG